MAKNLLKPGKRTVKKERISKTAVQLANIKHYGDEPTFKGPLDQSQYGRALNWYNVMFSYPEAREFLKVYLKQSGRGKELKVLTRVPDYHISTTCGWIARLMTRGYTLPSSSQEFFENRLVEILSKARPEVTETKDDTPKVSIQDRVRERTMDIIGDVEEMIDKGEEFSLYDWLKAKEIPATYATPIMGYYGPIVLELIEAYEGRDPQLKEGYKHLTKKQLKARIELYNMLVEDAGRYGNVVKKTRAPRKPRPVSIDKVLKHLKFQKEDATHKVASVAPEKIIGAQELWTFNTRYKVVTVFRAADQRGLQVQRSSITGFDEATSCSRGCGRGAEKVVDKIQKSGKIVLKKVMDELKTQKPLQHRINENTILLRVVT